MAIFRCWMYMNQGRQGWKESLYLATGTMPQALAVLAQLAQARAALLGEQAQLVRILVCNEPPNREYLAAGAPPPPGSGPALPPHTALLVRLQVGPAGLYHRSLYLRGLPQAWVTGPNLHTPQFTKQGLQAIGAYINAITGLGFSLRDNDKTAPSYPIVDVQPQVPEGFVLEPSPWVLLTTSQNTGLTVYDALGNQAYATVAGVKWLPPQVPGRKVNGVWPIIGVGINQVVLGASAPATGIYLGGGFMQGRGIVFSPITGGVPLRFVQKATGRALPFEGGGALGLVPLIRIGTAFSEEGPGSNPVQPPIPPPPPPGVINTARDLAVFVFTGYPTDILSVGMAPLSNLQNAWVVGVPGTNADASATYGAAIKTGFGLNTDFFNSTVAGIQRIAPMGSTLLLAGHSLGGMVCQGIVRPLVKAGYKVPWVVCYGSPYAFPALLPRSYVFFQCNGDVIPGLSPLNVTGQPKVTRLLLGYPDPPVTIKTSTFRQDIVTQHNSYPFDEDLNAYDAIGAEIEPGTTGLQFKYGPITRFQGPPLPGG